METKRRACHKKGQYGFERNCNLIQRIDPIKWLVKWGKYFSHIKRAFLIDFVSCKLILTYDFCFQKNGFENQAMSNEERIPPGYVPYEEEAGNSHHSRL